MNLTEQLRESYAPGVPYHVEIPRSLIHDLLFDTARRYPTRVALDFFSRQTTYEELTKQVRQAASALAKAGVKRGDRVALVLPNCPQHVVAIFATSLLGAIVVEHNPLAPPEEIRGEFERHGAKVVVAWENSVSKLSFTEDDVQIFGVNLANALPGLSRTLIRLPLPKLKEKREQLGAKTPKHVRSWDKIVAAAPLWEEDSPASPEDPALLIHTGGTTGVPKAVTLSHHNLCADVTQSIAWVPTLHEGAEVFYAPLPFFHAFGFSVSLLTGIRFGATIAIFPKFDPAQVLLSQRRLPCTFFVGVPPIYERLLKGAEDLNVDLSSISFALSGAMPIDAQLVAAWEAKTGGYLIEGYGMSEASPIILGSPVSPLRRPSSLGIPYPSTEIRIVDPENPDKDVENGEIGELLVRGPQVFLGYWNNLEETENVMMGDWLKTGDLVKVVDGFVVMADRRKELIISGGFNIYPTQVEEVIRSMPGISDVAVVGIPGGSRGEDVAAALVLEAGASLNLNEVRTWAEKSLAHYALPRQIVVLEQLPKSQLGKVMRKRVREQLADLQAGIEPAITNLATQVVDLAEQATSAVTNALGGTGDKREESATNDTEQEK